MRFLDGLDKDIQKNLLLQLRDLWTHSSTALEGNTLTLGETALLLNEGLTVSGKPLKDHQEVVGHARAIDLLYALATSSNAVTESDLFELHRAVQTQIVTDIYAPIGSWKNEPNGTYGRTSAGGSQFIEFAPPADVPGLMAEWLALLNNPTPVASPADALHAYAALHVSFVWVHPFFDGNGRMARLLANLPVLRAGLPPVVIPQVERGRYLQLLNLFNERVGAARAGKPVMPELESLNEFTAFCAGCWQATQDLLVAASKVQTERGR